MMEITRYAQSVILEQTGQDSEYHQAKVEVSSIELKKQTEQAKRFGNEKFKNHSRLNNVKGALQNIQSDQLLKLLKSATDTINGNTVQTNLNGQDVPLLKSPVNTQSAGTTSSEAKLSSAATATAILGKILQLTTEASLSNQLFQMQGLNLSLSAAAAAYGELADKLEQESTQWASDKDALDDARKQADALAEDANTAQSAYNDAEQQLASLEDEAAGQDPVPDALKQKIDAAEKTVNAANSTMVQAKTASDNFVTNTLNPAIKAESSSRSTLEATQSKAKTLVDSYSSQQQTAIEAQRKQSDESTKSLAYLMAVIAELINKSTSDDLQASADLKQKLAEAAEKDAEKKAKEYDEQVRKAEEMQKTMGCIGKIIGWAITGIGFIAAAFTGGASLVLATIGLAIAIGDEIGQAITGKSYLSEYVMNPIMEHTIKPMMELFAKVFTDILLSCGVDKDKAEMAGQILGAIAAAVVMVVVMIVAGNIASKLGGAVLQKLGLKVAEDVGEEVVKDVAKEATKEVTEEVTEKVVEKAAQTTVQKLMNSSVGQMFQRVSGGLGKAMGMEEAQIAKIANYAQKATTGMEFLNTVSQESVAIYTAQIQVDAAKTKAELQKDLTIQDVLNDMMDRAVDTFTNRMTTLNDIVKNMSAVADTHTQAGKYITQQMGVVAG